MGTRFISMSLAVILVASTFHVPRADALAMGNVEAYFNTPGAGNNAPELNVTDPAERERLRGMTLDEIQAEHQVRQQEAAMAERMATGDFSDVPTIGVDQTDSDSSRGDGFGTGSTGSDGEKEVIESNPRQPASGGSAQSDSGAGSGASGDSGSSGNGANGGAAPAAIGANSCVQQFQTLNCSSILKENFQALAVPSNYEDPAQCAKFLQDKENLSEVDENIQTNNLTSERVCRAIAGSCSGKSGNELKQCVTNETSVNGAKVVLGAEKCIAIYYAAKSTTDFEEGPTVGQDPVTCKDNKQRPGYAFDYPSCTRFIAWYNGLKATEMGLGLFNEADKTMTGMKAQSDMAKEVQKGNGQTAGIEGAKKSTLAAADAESRNKIFFASKGVAITSQLMMFVTKDNIECGTPCCKHFKTGKIKTNFFPNANVKSTMIAEVIKAGGAAVAAALKEAALKKQAALMKAAAAQLAGPEDDTDEGFMKFCQQFPQDVRCLGPGNRLSVGGNGYGSNIGGQNFGLGDLGAATTEDFNTETIKPGSGPAAAASVGGIGSFNKEAAEAKGVFNAPPAASAGGAPPAGGGGAGGGVGANASANGLSNDPGVQEEKKEDPLKVTSKAAKYDGGAGYNGGGWRDGGAKKPAGAENPFAAMFNKNKGRDIAAAKEIDSPASDLFTKISNRYSEVQKRKGLMDVADTNIR
jgi:hypothetical protein